MLRHFWVVVLCLCLGIFGGCISDNGKTKGEIILYSELEPEYTETLITAYNEQFKKQKNFQPIKPVYELKDNAPKPDLVLGTAGTLTRLKAERNLQKVECKSSSLLPAEFKDVDGYWTGVLYDPVVFVINHNFARRVGQKQLKSWSDLENLKDVRYVVENLNNSQGTMNLLAAMASHMGEQTAISFLWNLNRNITSYGKFPFSSIRMVATGEADMTVTVQSMVAKYLENEFPAYCIAPKEGAPANLYGLAVYKGSENTFSNQNFMNWFIVDDNARAALQKKSSGYMFFLPQGEKKPPVDPNFVWLNSNYSTPEKLEELTRQWVEKVRFSGK